ncbi:hypothetical protein ANO14919_129910 [Xylariales sp. No.14919]|nr:hypothetical protein ANO14919_129910 [Xylariales sp. No.14919]
MQLSITKPGYDLATMKRQHKDDRVYLSELDVHFPELTLGQTLTFTASMRNKYLAKNAGNAIASFFGLDAAFDTRARNRGIRASFGRLDQLQQTSCPPWPIHLRGTFNPASRAVPHVILMSLLMYGSAVNRRRRNYVMRSNDSI